MDSKDVFLQLGNKIEFPAKTIFTNISTGNWYCTHILPLVDPLAGPTSVALLAWVPWVPRHPWNFEEVCNGTHRIQVPLIDFN